MMNKIVKTLIKNNKKYKIIQFNLINKLPLHPGPGVQEINKYKNKEL